MPWKRSREKTGVSFYLSHPSPCIWQAGEKRRNVLQILKVAETLLLGRSSEASETLSVAAVPMRGSLLSLYLKSSIVRDEGNFRSNLAEKEGTRDPTPPSCSSTGEQNPVKTRGCLLLLQQHWETG